MPCRPRSRLRRGIWALPLLAPRATRFRMVASGCSRSAEYVQKNLEGIVATLKSIDNDILLLQEVSQHSLMSWWQPLYDSVAATVPERQIAYRPDIHTTLLPFPLAIDHGTVVALNRQSSQHRGYSTSARPESDHGTHRRATMPCRWLALPSQVPRAIGSSPISIFRPTMKAARCVASRSLLCSVSPSRSLLRATTLSLAVTGTRFCTTPGCPARRRRRC